MLPVDCAGEVNCEGRTINSPYGSLTDPWSGVKPYNQTFSSFIPFLTSDDIFPTITAVQ